VLEGTNVVKNEVLEPITFFLAYHAVYGYVAWHGRINERCLIIRNLEGSDFIISNLRYTNLVGRVEKTHEKLCND